MVTFLTFLTLVTSLSSSSDSDSEGSRTIWRLVEAGVEVVEAGVLLGRSAIACLLEGVAEVAVHGALFLGVLSLAIWLSLRVKSVTTCACSRSDS